MSRLINSTYITIDGAVENPQDWPSGRHQDDGRAQQIQTELLLSCETVLMGRRTYDGFAPSGRVRSGDPYSDHINAMEKLVASTTLTEPTWTNTTVVATDLIGEVDRRKRAGGRHRPIRVRRRLTNAARRRADRRAPPLGPPADDRPWRHQRSAVSRRHQRQLRAGRRDAARLRDRDPQLPGLGPGPASRLLATVVRAARTARTAGARATARRARAPAAAGPRAPVVPTTAR